MKKVIFGDNNWEAATLAAAAIEDGLHKKKNKV